MTRFSSAIGHIHIYPFYADMLLNDVLGDSRESTYLCTHAAVTRVVGFRGQFDGKFEGPAVAIAIIGLGFWKWGFHYCFELVVERKCTMLARRG